MLEYQSLISHVARLVYLSGTDYFDTLFGSRELALQRLEVWISRASSGFAYERITLALIDGEIAGVVLALTGRELVGRQRADMLQLIKEGGTWQREMVLQKAVIIRAMTPPVQPNEYYLRSLSVDEAHRGKGFGRALLKHFINDGLKKGFARFRLDVRNDNLTAINLYRSAGFKTSAEFAIPQAGWKLQSLILESPECGD